MVIQKDGLNFGACDHKIQHTFVCHLAEEPVPVVRASTHTRQLVAVFQVLCSLYRLTCVGYAQNSLEFVSHSPLIHMVGESFCLYTDSLFAQIGDLT
jgi:hypothetical protein